MMKKCLWYQRLHKKGRDLLTSRKSDWWMKCLSIRSFCETRDFKNEERSKVISPQLVCFHFPLRTSWANHVVLLQALPNSRLTQRNNKGRHLFIFYRDSLLCTKEWIHFIKSLLLSHMNRSQTNRELHSLKYFFLWIVLIKYFEREIQKKLNVIAQREILLSY